MPSSSKRTCGFAAFAPVVLAVALAGCGGDDTASPGTEVEIKPSSYVTTPSTTAPANSPAAPSGEPGSTATQEQVHVVKPGEFLSGIAADYDVTMDEIIEYNQWSDGLEHQLNPDDQVRIPPGARIPSPDDDDDEDETESTDEPDDETENTDDADDDPELCPDGEPQGRYTITEADTTRVGVAERLDVTVEQLDRANADTPGYSAFFPGLEIVLPCGDEEAGETTEE